MPRTVITIPGFGASYNTSNFGGAPFGSPNVRIASPSGGWNNWISDSSAVTDMNALYTLMLNNKTAQPDGLMVFGHSRGGQMIYKLFRQRKADLVANFDPAKVLFVSSGNPERKYGGASVYDYAGHNPIYPGNQPYLNGYGLPDPSPFTVIDIARQYDEWADHPKDLTNTAAHNLTTSVDVHSAYAGAASLGEDGWPLDWLDWTWWQEGTVYYLVSPYFPHPSTPAQPAKTTLGRMYGPLAKREDEQYGYADSLVRAANEAGFRRVKPVQPPKQFRYVP